MEISAEKLMSEYDEMLAQANRTIVLLRAENAILREELAKKEGDTNG